MKDEELISLPSDSLIDLSLKGYLLFEKVSPKEACIIIGNSQSGHPSYHIIPHIHGTVNLLEAKEGESVYNSIIFLKKCFKK